MADDNSTKKYGGLTPKADAKQDKFPFRTSEFTKDINTLQDKMESTERGRLGDISIEKKLNTVIEKQGKASTKSVITAVKMQEKFLKEFSNKTKLGGGINKKELMQLLTIQNKSMSGKNGIDRVRGGDMPFSGEMADSLSEISSILRKQLYFIKQMSGFFDDAPIPPLLRMDEETFGDMFMRSVKRGLHAAFPTFIRIGKAIGKPFYKLFRARGGNYIYSSHLSTADSPFRQISENVGVLYTGSMLRMDRMIIFQKATAEAVRDLSTHITGKGYAAIEDLKPSKKFRLITSIIKGVGKTALGLGAGALGLTGAMGLAPMLGLGGLGAAGLAAGGAGLGALLGWKKGGSAIKGVGKGAWGLLTGKKTIGGMAKGAVEGIKGKVKGFGERLKFWKRRPEEDENLLGGTKEGVGSLGVFTNKRAFRDLIKRLTIFLWHDTKKRPISVDISRKSIFAKKKKENVLDVALSPEFLNSFLKTAENTTKIVEGKIIPPEPRKSLWDTIKNFLPFLGPMIGGLFGIFKNFFGGMIPGLLSKAGGFFLSFVPTLLKGAWGALSTMIPGLLKSVVPMLSGALRLIPGVGWLIAAAAGGWKIGSWINETFITPFLDARDKRDQERSKENLAKVSESFKTQMQDRHKEGEEGWAAGRSGSLKRIIEKDKKLHKLGISELGLDTTTQHIQAAQRAYITEHAGEYLLYSSGEIERVRAEWNAKHGIFSGMSLLEDPNEFGREREADFLKYLKEKGKPMTEAEKAASIEKYQKEAEKVRQTKSNNQSSAADITKKAQEARNSAINSLQRDYGVNASDAARYVDQAIKANEGNTAALTDATTLAKVASEFIDKNNKEIPNGNNPANYDAETEQDIAKAELQASSVSEGIADGLKPMMENQNKALTQVAANVSRAGVNNTSMNANNVSNTSATSNSNYNFPGQKDRWSEEAQNGRIFR